MFLHNAMILKYFKVLKQYPFMITCGVRFSTKFLIATDFIVLRGINILPFHREKQAI